MTEMVETAVETTMETTMGTDMGPFVEKPVETEARQQAMAAAGGEAYAQLRHLRHHLAFQRQDRHTHMEIDWKTRITREESRRHITRELHAKINLKGGTLDGQGRMAKPEAQQDLKRLGRMATNRERPSRGDLFRLSHGLQSRIARACRPWLRIPVYGREWLERKRRNPRIPVWPPQEDFPLEHQVNALRLERLRELLVKQGASPRRARRARILEALACGGCHNLVMPEPDTARRPCPVCGAVLHRDLDTVEIAVRDGTNTPIGNIDCHRR